MGNEDTNKNRKVPELKPHEIKHLFNRRLFVFMDEWLSYAFLLWLYNNNPELLLIATPMVVIFNYIGYIHLWELREHYGIITTSTNIQKNNFLSRIVGIRLTESNDDIEKFD